MRLTLRALLAYLDEMLEPADAQELGQRIEASPFATDLMHRVRDVTRRLKLGAPKVSGRGLTGDPNTVSEYLDNTMPPEQVTEFEKICLKSDVHLAEVAAAHQILALVLGEPAEVDQKLRRRMYELPQQHDAMLAAANDAAESTNHADTGASAAAELGQRRPRRRPEVPEWLREQPRDAITPGALPSLLVSWSWRDWPDICSSAARGPGHWWRAPKRLRQVPQSPQTCPAKVHPLCQRTLPWPACPRKPRRRAKAFRSSPSPRTNLPRHRQPRWPITLSQPPSQQRPNWPRQMVLLRQVRCASRRSWRTWPARSAPRGADQFQDDITRMPAEEERPSALDDQALVPGGAKPAKSAAGEPAAAVPVGRLIRDGDILLHRTGPDGGWKRLSMQDLLVADEELIALPTFRPGIAFSEGGGAIAASAGRHSDSAACAERQRRPGNRCDRWPGRDFNGWKTRRGTERANRRSALRSDVRRAGRTHGGRRASHAARGCRSACGRGQHECRPVRSQRRDRVQPRAGRAPRL